MTNLLVRNEHLVPAHIFPYILSCIVAGYLSDAVKMKVIRQEDVTKIRQLFMRDLKNLIDQAHRHEIGATPVEDDVKPLTFEFQ